MNKNKDIKPYNDKGQEHGYCEGYWSDGTLWYKCYSVNGKEVGYEEYYFYSRSKIHLTFHL